MSLILCCRDAQSPPSSANSSSTYTAEDGEISRYTNAHHKLGIVPIGSERYSQSRVSSDVYSRDSKPISRIAPDDHYLNLPVCRLTSMMTYMTINLPECTAHLLQRPLVLTSVASRAFTVAAPTVWNSLSVNTRSADSFASFKHRLKT